MPSTLFPQRPPFPHFNFDALHNPTFTPPLAPFLPISSPQPSRLLSNHTPFYSSTFLRFCKFTENNKLPINRPIKTYTSLLQTYHQPIHCQQPFSPNALHSPIPPTRPPFLHSPNALHFPIPILTHCTIQPLCLHWHPLLPISSPQPSRLLSNHTPYYSFTFLRFCKFTENNKTADKPPH